MYNDELTKKLAETAKRIIAGESVEAIEEGAEKDTKGDKEAYTKFFNDTLKKYGVKSPAELKGDDEKKFYDEIDAGWKADDEKPEKNESKVGKLTKDKKKKKNLAFDDEEDEPRVKKALRGESVELEDDEDEDVEEGLVGNLIKKGAKRFLTRKGRNDARAKKLKKLKSKEAEIRRSKQLKRDIKNAKKDVKKARRESTEELEEGKIDLNKKFNTSDAAFDYFHSFAVADQAKTDQEVEKSKKKFAKNTLGFWMQNLTDTLKGMGISEETELELTEEEEDEIVASILDTIPDAEAAADDDNHPDEEDILVTLDKTTGYKVVDNLPEETEKLDARRREFREKIRKLAYEKAKKMIKGISDADDEEEKVEGVDKPLKVQKDEATGAVSVSHVKEEIRDKVNEDSYDKSLGDLKKTLEKEYGSANFKKLKFVKIKQDIVSIQTPSGQELERYQRIPKTGWRSISEGNVNEESTEKLEEKRKSKSDYEIYHDSYTSALSEVLDLVDRNGYKVNDDLWFTKVSTGPRKPSAGKTNSFTLELEKDGKPTRKVVSFQVYGLESGRYELNAYIS